MTETRSVTVERDLPFPPGRVWRALTRPELISEWLMQTDFAPETGHAFTFRGDWGSVDCEVREVEPERRLAYTWVAMGLDSMVTWTLTPTDTGTRLRMEQAGFPKDFPQAYAGAKASWPDFIDRMEAVLARESDDRGEGA